MNAKFGWIFFGENLSLDTNRRFKINLDPKFGFSDSQNVLFILVFTDKVL